MLISKLEYAESIVKKFNDLRWDGWNIISRQQTPNGFSSKHGSFINGKWGIDKVYPLTEKGWYLPNNYGDKK
jgi:hypothetical protein